MNQAWIDILENVMDLQRKAEHCGGALWFRGHRRACWTLKSRLHRYIEDCLATRGPGTAADRKQLLREEYTSCYRQFKAPAWSILEPHQRGEWSLVFGMQHHGIPTRLLDWTESFACALYFAQLDREPAEDAAIFVADPNLVNKRSTKVSSLIALDDDLSTDAIPNTRQYHPRFVPPPEDLPTVAVAPVLTHPRMVVQRSAFMLTGDSFDPIENQCCDAITKIVLPASTYAEAQDFLRLIGASAVSYFPDLEGLSWWFRDREDRTRAVAKQLKANNAG